MRYRGTLEVEPSREGGGLPVLLDLTDRRLTVTSDGDILGTYPISQVHVARRGSDRFDLQVADEHLVFTAEDALRFSYEAMPAIAAGSQDTPQQVLTKVRNWWKDRTEPSDAVAGEPVESPTPEPPRVDASEPPPVVERRNPDFTPEPSSTVSLAELRRRFRSNVVDDPEPVTATRPDAPVREQDVAEEPATPRHLDRRVIDLSERREEAKPAPPEGVALETCKGLRADGTPCGSAVVSERGFCFAHDPERAVERRRVQEQTNAAAQRVRRSGRDMADVLERLERAVVEVHEGRLDPQQALAMASLAQAMIDTIELTSKTEKPERD